VLALWSPGQSSWALALLAAADGSHHVSLRSMNGDVDLVLHHHSIPPDADEATVDADDHPHGDHVIHLAGTGGGLAASRLAMATPLQFCLHGAVSSRAVACEHSLLCVARRSAIGVSPPSLRAVLQI